MVICPMKCNYGKQSDVLHLGPWHVQITGSKNLIDSHPFASNNELFCSTLVCSGEWLSDPDSSSSSPSASQSSSAKLTNPKPQILNQGSGSLNHTRTMCCTSRRFPTDMGHTD